MFIFSTLLEGIKNLKDSHEGFERDSQFIKRLKSLSGLQEKRDFLKRGANLVRTIDLIKEGNLSDDLTKPCVHGTISNSIHNKH